MPTDNIPRLSWGKQDIEQWLGFSGARHTRVNNVLSFLMACVAALSFYGILYFGFRDRYFASMFTERGWVPFAIIFFSAWALSILAIKFRKLALQHKALQFLVIPDQHDFVLSVVTVDDVIERIFAIADDPRQFVLFDRILVALSNLRNLGRVTDVDEILRSHADQDAAAMETSYALVEGFVWAIPVLGFIGTVIGLSQAIGGFSSVLTSVTEVEHIVDSLQGVTVGLATAFETTLEALIAALVIQLLLTVLKKSEQEFHDECSDYCGRNIVGKLRILPFEAEVG